MIHVILTLTAAPTLSQAASTKEEGVGDEEVVTEETRWKVGKYALALNPLLPTCVDLPDNPLVSHLSANARAGIALFLTHARTRMRARAHTSGARPAADA